VNDQRFDDLARRFARVGLKAATRRAFLKGAASATPLATAALNTGAVSRSRAQETSPPARPVNRPAGGPTATQLAWDLKYDPERIFAFVRDEVRYDPYSGVLRGAKGTLWGLAGNSPDQATLLASLLSEALVDTRFIVGELDDASAARLAEEARWDEATVREHTQKVLDFVNPGSEAVTLPEPTAEQQMQAQQLIDEGVRAIEAAGEQIDQTVQVLQSALAAEGIELPAAGDGPPERERTQHVWLQFRNGAEWIDLDPVFPDAVSGTAFAANGEVLDELPAELFHSVTLRVIGEVVRGGHAVEEELLTYHARAADLAGEALTFAHLSPKTYHAIGFSINGALEGTTQFIPNVFGPGEGEAGLPVTFGGGAGGDVFASADSSEGETIAEWLEIEVAAVDRPVRRERRTVFDRIGIEKRLAGSIDVSALPPIELTDFGDGQSGYMPLEAVTRIAISGSMVPGSFFMQDYTVADPLGDLSNSLYGQLYSRTMLGLDRALRSGARLFPNAPGVSMLTLAPRVINADRAEGQMIFDLVHQGLNSQSTSQTTPASNPGILGGVLDHISERLVLESAHRAIGGEGPPPASVGRLIEAALVEEVSIVTLAPGATPGADLAFSERARAGIDRALADGYVVVVPERAIDLGGESLTGWWQIDPAAGTAVDRLETGQGAAVLLSPMGEGMVVIYNGVHGVIAIKRMTLCVAAIYLGGAILLGAGATAGAMAATGNVAAYVAAAAVAVGPGYGGMAAGAIACS
jgi:hypothetical protein